MRRELIVLALAASSLAATAAELDNEAAWQEIDAPPPPALRTDRLVGVDMQGSELRFGVQPDSVSIGKDGVVRYVVVAQSRSGTVNASYEGLRCNTGEVKVYARHSPDSGWTAASNANWQPLRRAGGQRHSLEIAQAGACMGKVPNVSPTDILRDLAGRGPEPFRRELR